MESPNLSSMETVCVSVSRLTQRPCSLLPGPFGGTHGIKGAHMASSKQLHKAADYDLMLDRTVLLEYEAHSLPCGS